MEGADRFMLFALLLVGAAMALGILAILLGL
jgi:hypothetical protein